MYFGDPLKHWLLLFAYSLWEHWLSTTSKTAAGSTWALLIGLLKGDKTMESDVKLGNVGDLDLKFENGQASLTLNAKVPSFPGAEAGVVIKVDAVALVDLIAKAVDKALPNTPLDNMIFESLKAVVASIK